MNDPYAGIGEDRPTLPPTGGDWWKPAAPERIIGKLDAVMTNKNGDYLVFPSAVTYRMPDHHPIRGGKVLLNISKDLEGRISSHDSGSYVVLTFTGWSDGSENPRRLFAVAVISPDRADKVAAAIATDLAFLESGK